MGVCVCVTVCVCHKLFNEHLRKKIPGDFPGGSDGKVSAYSVGDPGSIPGLGRSKWQPIPVFLPGKLQSMGSQSQTVN